MILYPNLPLRTTQMWRAEPWPHRWFLITSRRFIFPFSRSEEETPFIHDRGVCWVITYLTLAVYCRLTEKRRVHDDHIPPDAGAVYREPTAGGMQV